MKEIIEDARIEDRNHFEAVVPRIYETRPDDIPASEAVMTQRYRALGMSDKRH